MQQIRRNEEMRYLQNQANNVGERILQSFDEDNAERYQAMKLLYKNHRPSEFIAVVRPKDWPNAYPPDWSIWDRIPEYTSQWAFFKTKTLQDEYRKMEALIDFLRRKYKFLAKKERIARRKFEKIEDKRNKYRDMINGFYNFGKIGEKLRTR